MTEQMHERNAIDDELLTIDEAAAIIRTPIATLRYWRHLGRGPRGFRVGRNVRYWQSDVLEWLHQQCADDPDYR